MGDHASLDRTRTATPKTGVGPRRAVLMVIAAVGVPVSTLLVVAALRGNLAWIGVF
jgi:hypothetical protein